MCRDGAKIKWKNENEKEKVEEHDKWSESCEEGGDEEEEEQRGKRQLRKGLMMKKKGGRGRGGPGRI